MRCGVAGEQTMTRLGRPGWVAARGLTGWLLTAAALSGVAGGCASINETIQLRARPLEAPRTVEAEVESGTRVRGQRDATNVRVEAETVRYCAKATRQRAMGIREVRRQAQGNSLTLEWLFGGLFTAAGITVLSYNAVAPPKLEAEEAGLSNEREAWWTGGAIAGAGLGLLAAAWWQQASLGVHTTELGVRELEKRGRHYVCRAETATAGTVRLELSDGTLIEATIGVDGKASLPLPADIDERLRQHGRKATLEALGDWRSQVRIDL